MKVYLPIRHENHEGSSFPEDPPVAYTNPAAARQALKDYVAGGHLFNKLTIEGNGLGPWHDIHHFDSVEILSLEIKDG